MSVTRSQRNRSYGADLIQNVEKVDAKVLLQNERKKDKTVS